MRRRIRRGLILAVALVAADHLLAQESLAGRVKTAEDAVRANSASPQGKKWKKDNSAAAGRLILPVLNQCLPDPPGDIPTVFAVYVRLSAKGRALDVVTEIDANLGTCMTAAARDVAFPAPPRDDYWIQLNMAAPL